MTLGILLFYEAEWSAEKADVYDVERWPCREVLGCAPKQNSSTTSA